MAIQKTSNKKFDLIYLLSSNETLLKDANNTELLDSYRKECTLELFNRAQNPNHVKEQLAKIIDK
jgi:hypothetical protein